MLDRLAQDDQIEQSVGEWQRHIEIGLHESSIGQEPTRRAQRRARDIEANNLPHPFIEVAQAGRRAARRIEHARIGGQRDAAQRDQARVFPAHFRIRLGDLHREIGVVIGIVG